MKASYIQSYGPPSVLQFGDLPDPKPKNGTVLISVKAASINPLDYKIRNGNLKFMTGSKFPKILGSDFSGVIHSLGDGVTGIKIGDPFYGVVATIFGKQGAFAELVEVPISNLRPVPSGMSFENAASLPVAALTALHGLRQCGDLNGKTVLINGATGGVGHFATQIAKARGAIVTAVCSAKNSEFAKELGASQILDYSKTNVLTNNLKYDIIFDASAKLSFNETLPILTKRGYYISTLPGLLSFFKIPILKILGGKQMVAGNMRAKQEDFAELELLISKGEVKPVIGQTYSLSQINEALELVESGKAKAKILVKIP